MRQSSLRTTTGRLAPLDWRFNQAAGTVRVIISATDVDKWSATMVFAEYTPAIAAYYDRGGKETVRLDEVELNPAFAGLANGYVYLQHKIWQPKSLILQVDKPRVPYTVLAERPEDIEFGPVYEEDSAVLTVTAFGSNENELISGAKLLVTPDRRTWSGAINHQDPSKEDVWLTTGADGSASMVFTPGRSYGQYIALSSVCREHKRAVTTCLAGAVYSLEILNPR